MTDGRSSAKVAVLADLTTPTTSANDLVFRELAGMDSAEVSTEANLEALNATSQSYAAAIKLCLEMVDTRLKQKAVREVEIRTAVRCSTVLPTTQSIFRTPYFQDDKLVAAPAIDVEVEMNMLLETDDPYEGRHIWKRDQDMLLSELVTRRRKEIRLVNLEIERKKAIRKIKDLGVILDKLQEFGESGRLREELSQPDNEQAGKLRRQLLLEVLDDQDAVGYCEKAISTSKVEAEELAKELEELMSPCYPASKLFYIALAKYDWFALASHPKLKHHGEEACQLRFRKLLDPTLKKASTQWLKKEKEKLMTLVGVLGEHDWDSIASGILGRTAVSCCRKYFQIKDEEVKSELLQPRARWEVQDIVRLVHAWLSSQGVWSALPEMVPGKNTTLCRRFWEAHFDLNSSRAPWTPSEINKVGKFGRKKKSKRVDAIRILLARRNPFDVRKLFESMFRRDEATQSWIEVEDFVSVPEPSERKAAIAYNFCEHILSTVTEPLRDDASLDMEMLLSSDEVMAPAKAMLQDLRLLTSRGRSDGLQVVRRTLSDADRELVEAYIAPVLTIPRQIGRKRTTNLFGTIPRDLQPRSREEYIKLVEDALNSETTADIVHLPPSISTLEALIKMREVVAGASVIPREKAVLMCDETDLKIMERKVQGLLLTSEILRISHKQRMDNRVTATSLEGTLEASTPLAKKKRPASVKATFKKFAWQREARQQKRLERMAKKAEPSKVKGKRGGRTKDGGAISVPQRQSCRLKRAEAVVC